jgi:hypothetical protein
MKKKRILRNWVRTLIGYLMILDILLFSLDTENMFLFIMIHLITFISFMIKFIIIFKYGNLYE